MTRNYKLRVYNLDGDLDHEEFFESLRVVLARFDELCRTDHNLCEYNPTMWINDEIAGWIRMRGVF